MQAIVVPHHRKIFWLAAATAIVGFLLLIAARLPAVEMPYTPSFPLHTTRTVGEFAGVILLGVSLSLLAWAWHLMNKGTGPHALGRHG